MESVASQNASVLETAYPRLSPAPVPFQCFASGFGTWIFATWELLCCLYIYIYLKLLFFNLFVLARGGQVVHTPTLFKKLKGQTLEEVCRFERATPKKKNFIIVKGLLKIIVYLHFAWGGWGGESFVKIIIEE